MAPPAEPASLAWSAALLSWVLAVPLWYVARFAVVVAHEGGHALLVKVLFQKLDSVRFDKHAQGVTKPASEVPWLVNVLVLLAGYLGPSLFGLIGVWLLVHDRPEAVLWASLAFLLCMLFAVRGFVGWLLVPALFVVIVLIAVRVDPPLQTLYAHMWVWLLLIGAVQRMLLFVRDKQYDDAQNDSISLQRLTLVPSAIWAFVLLIGTTAALAYGGAMLLRGAG